MSRLLQLDTLIAAQALALGATVVTNDRAFEQVQDLHSIENRVSDL